MPNRVLSSSAAHNKQNHILKTPESSIKTPSGLVDKENLKNQSAQFSTTPKISGETWEQKASTSASLLNVMSTDEKELSDSDKSKRAAAFACGQDHLKSGQRIGVGSGTTAKFLVEYIEKKFNSGELTNIRCVPTSFQTRQWLLNAKLPVSTPEEDPTLDIAIDGADEIDSNFNCIKGGGGCLTQEKIVQECAEKFILIAGKDKLSSYLGQKFKYIPIEVVPVAYVPVKNWIEKEHGGNCELRMSKKKCGAEITDNNNYILDWYFPESSVETDWNKINVSISCRSGVVETGLFINAVNYTYLGSSDGDVVKKRAK